ncbi:hypothetical protein [Lactococcus ileimucosae]|uniref:hypothetical protein n=1 Tax=Lactococcus ileimucosae TaxID=2941329 RepID=UPI002044B238|nr:hypothetical protein [Lactococcus ileimucosae]
MTPEKKNQRRLRNLAFLSLLLLAVGGTFAFQAFNQRAINDRLNDVQVNVGGRVHDYYNRDTENKDVFVENYGERPIMARIRLSEFLETRQTGETDFTPLVSGSQRDQLDSWTTWIPSPDDINVRANIGNSNAFNRYSRLTFGWSRQGEYAPWYMPTFNHDNLDLMTAAAGHARDYIAGGGATDAVTDGATHPGAGTDAYWSENDDYENGSQGTTWPGIIATHTAAQNLQEQRAPMTIEQWNSLQDYQKIGDFWVIDHETGWAYWASLLEPGQATSYLLDAAEMLAAIEDTVFNGSYYYGIHVDSELISPGEEFTDEAGASGNLADFLTGIRNNAMDGEGSNPRADVDSPPSAFNFDAMLPGRAFTMEGEQYRYLEDMANGNHMIIRNEAIRNVSWEEQNDELVSWYAGLDDEVKAMVRPVNLPAPGSVPDVAAGAVQWNPDYGPRFLPSNFNEAALGAVVNDVTTIASSGSGRAFALSLADVVRLSGSGRGFQNHAGRVGARSSFWWLRTPGISGDAWNVRQRQIGQLFTSPVTDFPDTGGVRPALIINQ